MAGATVKISTKGLAEAKKKLFAVAAKKQTQRLCKYADLMLKKAYNKKSFANQTWNLADSYVWVVYYLGEVQGSGFIWNGERATEESRFHGQKINGRALAENFISTYPQRNMNGWEVVWAATAPYSTYLESGTIRHGKFLVLSGIYDEVVSDFGNRARVNFEIVY